jgi:hypothetical protein
MEGYCLTCYTGTEPERFGLKVVSVVRDIEPGRDAILVMGTDERFLHTGPVAGCSGSPVYLDGRMAGALAFGWTFSKDPLYGVTPIRQMLQIGGLSPAAPAKGPGAGSVGPSGRAAVNFSQPIDLGQWAVQPGSSSTRCSAPGREVSPLPCALMVSGLPSAVADQMVGSLAGFGVQAVSTVGGREDPAAGSNGLSLAPGGAMMVPLVDGDIRMAVLGTVTEVQGDKVYGFGHNLLGCGPVDLPLATARIHTVVSSVERSIKVGSMVDVVGALTVDEPTGVVGRVGREAKTIPFRIEVTNAGGSQTRRFDCRLACNKALTPDLIRSVLAGAAQFFGSLPPDHTITYSGRFDLDSGRTIRFSNVSSGAGLGELLSEGMGPATLLMNNPFREISIQRAEFKVSLAAENRASSLETVDVSDRKVKPGQEITVGAVVQSYPSVRRRFEFKLRVPGRLEPGEYNLTVCGSYDYLQILRRLTPHRFLAKDARTLVDALQYLLGLRRDRLYCLLELPASGVTVDRNEMPDLPATKALILESTNETVPVQPFQSWIEKSLETDTLIGDKETLKITVEKP